MTHAISAAGLALVQEHEGFRADPAQLPDGNWVVGHGHVRIGEAGPAVSAHEAEHALSLDLAPYERLINARVNVALTQAQFDALVSFAFSVGAEAFEQSQVLRRVNAGDFLSAACAMDAWRKSEVNGELEVVDALVRRRAAEKALFLKDLAHAAAPSVFMRARLDHAASILGAPVKYAAAPAVGSIPVVQAQPEPAQRITEILNAEPATEALLLTQVVANDIDDCDEIVTAHAKPVARPFDAIREATRAAYAQQAANDRGPRLRLFKRAVSNVIEPKQPKLKPDRRIRNMRKRNASPFTLPRLDVGGSFENAGLVALMVFGLGLTLLGGSLLIGGSGDTVELLAGFAVLIPGLAASAMAAIGLRRTPQPSGV